MYATIHNSDLSRFTTAVEQSTSITNVDVLRETEGMTLVGLTVSDFTLVDALATQEATVQAIRVGPDGGRATVLCSPSMDIRTFVETCQERLSELRLVRRQPLDAETTSGSGLKYDLTDLLTQKQLEAIQTAYFQGYFEWPRDASGTDVAATLDVSAPTFQQHLRKGLKRIFEDIFDARIQEP